MQLMACNVNTVPCPTGDQVLINSTATELFLNGGFDLELFYLVTEACFLLWISSYGIGMIIAMVRKSRSPR